jgi:hypothetical protein
MVKRTTHNGQIIGSTPIKSTFIYKQNIFRFLFNYYVLYFKT